MSYGQHFFIRARPGAVRQPDCKAVFCAKGQRSLTERHRYGAVARDRSDTGSEPNMRLAGTAGKSAKCAASTRSISGPSFLRSSFALHAGPNRWCASRLGVKGEVRDVSAIVRAYCRTDRCIKTSPHRLFWWCSSPVACAQQAVHRYCLNLRPSGAECPHTRNTVGHVQGWPVPALSRQE